jgi:LmbE family N-acetylglucosaminyl deacetylase
MKKNNHQKLKILVIGGHPADAFDNCGGTCLHHYRRGDSITAVVLTHGARIHDVVISDLMRKKGSEVPQGDHLRKLIEKRSKVKQNEVRKACAIMGIKDVRFLTYDDHIFLVREDVISDLSRLIREIKPDIIITHYPYDSGGFADQHAITSQTVLWAIWVAGGVDPDDKNQPHRVPQVFFMGFPSHIIRGHALESEFSCHCQVYVDISDVIHLKLKAINMLSSQQYSGLYARKRTESVDGTAGLIVGTGYAEPFMPLYADVYDTLQVSDYQLKTANELESTKFDRLGFLVTKYGNLANYKKFLKKRNK